MSQQLAPRPEPPSYVGQPWEQQHGWRETARAYRAFLIYRDMPPEDRHTRKAMETYRLERGLKPSSDPHRGTSGLWPSKFRWVERAQAFDAYMDAQEVEAYRRRRIEAARRHADQATQVQEAMIRPIQVYRERLEQITAGKRTDELAELSDEELIRLGRSTASILSEFQKAEREALGQATGEDRSSGESERVAIWGDVLKRVMADPGERDTLEAVQFRVLAETQTHRSDTREESDQIPGRESGGGPMIPDQESDRGEGNDPGIPGENQGDRP